MSSQGVNKCFNYLAEKLQHVRNFAFYVPHRLLNVPIVLLSFHIFLTLTCGQVWFFFFVSFAQYKKGISVLSCFTEVSRRED